MELPCFLKESASDQTNELHQINVNTLSADFDGPGWQFKWFHSGSAGTQTVKLLNTLWNYLIRREINTYDVK